MNEKSGSRVCIEVDNLIEVLSMAEYSVSDGDVSGDSWFLNLETGDLSKEEGASGRELPSVDRAEWMDEFIESVGAGDPGGSLDPTSLESFERTLKDFGLDERWKKFSREKYEGEIWGWLQEPRRASSRGNGGRRELATSA